MSVEQFKISKTETKPVIFTFALEVEKDKLNKENQNYRINEAKSIFQIINSEGKNTVPNVTDTAASVVVRKEGEEGLVEGFDRNGKLLVDVTVHDPNNIDDFKFDWERHKEHNQGVIGSIFKEEENEKTEGIQMGEEDAESLKQKEEEEAAAAALKQKEEEEAAAAEARDPEKVFANIPDGDKNKPHLLIVQNEEEPKTSSVYAYVPHVTEYFRVIINFVENLPDFEENVTNVVNTKAPLFLDESGIAAGIWSKELNAMLDGKLYFHFFNFNGKLPKENIDTNSNINNKSIIIVEK